MTSHDPVILIYCTCPTMADAERIGAALVDKGLIACANILPGMVSIYVWQGTRQRDQEVVLILKTRKTLAGEVVAAATALHPYENPALLVVDVADGAPAFLQWIASQTAAPRA